MATKKAGKASNRVSFHIDDMASAGLPDDFDGVITTAVYAPFDYGGKTHDVLAAKLTITPDADSGLEEFTQYYSAGDIEAFAPSTDGEESVDLNGDDRDAMEGPYVVKVGTKERMNNNSNFAQFVKALVEAAKAAGSEDEIGEKMRSGDLSQLEGISGHWNRMPQPQRKGIVVRTDDKNADREKTLLVITALGDSEAPAPKAKAKAAPAAKAAPVAAKGKKAPEPEPDADEDDLDTQIEEAIVDALGAAADNTFAKGKLPGIMMKAFAGKPEKAKAIKRAGEVEFLGAATQFAFDPDDGTLTLV